ncbi:MAG: hypothetical protein AVDCRST_MAG64-397 [uncultured Phycisphaerae bacterium]|uniref:Methyltransferase domain-containing protein n=1 Tax=uncultured Phycisphaerae bacterium TaxID=904963 RepID=A0A6J4N4T3_9BACT|nr:MAG: hypothetical protein AVDCRST_MAG64-397 [uncultured Phycisphaerae bacterium]
MFKPVVNRPLLLVALLAFGLVAPTARGEDVEGKVVPYVPTPQEVVDKMLELAAPKKGEVLYDLGCGDGRIVVTAAKKFGVKGTGVDIDPERIKESNENAKEAGVTEQVKFVIKDLFKMDFKDADIITLYLLPTINEQLRPQLLKLRPGTRIVSHAFSMGDWEPDQEVTMEDPGNQNIYFWVIPAKAEGSHTVAVKGKDGESQEVTLDLKQKYQMVTGTATIGGEQVEISDGRLRGRTLSFTAGGEKYTAKIGKDEDEKKASVAEAEGDATDSAQPAADREEGEGEKSSDKAADEGQDKDAGAAETGTEAETETEGASEKADAPSEEKE